MKYFILFTFLYFGSHFVAYALTPWEYTYEAEQFDIVLAEVTAYNAEESQTDDTPTITASNKKVRVGMIACPRHLPFGTEIIVEDVSYFCEDRMNKRFVGHYYDIFMQSKKEALSWGRRLVEVKIVYAAN